MTRQYRGGALVIAAILLQACGGGGGGGGGPTANSPSVACGAGQLGTVTSGFSGDVNFEAPGGGDGGVGVGGGDGGGGVGIGVGEGKVVGALVIVRDNAGNKVGEAVTDAKDGMVTFKPCRPDYNQPVEAEVVGQPGATYYDEALAKDVPYGADKRLRVRVDKIARNLGITGYTEAAVRLMEARGATSISSSTQAQIADANKKVGQIVTDQVPGIYRPRDANGTIGRIEITRLPAVLSSTNAQTPGTIDTTPRGQYGAVNAGFAQASGTYLPGDPAPAHSAAIQLAEDLADGTLDMQGLNGPVRATGAPAYTYESLWRAKTVGAGLTSVAAGTTEVRNAAASSLLSEYVSDSSNVYRTDACLTVSGQACNPFDTRTDALQIVRLFSDGRLFVERGMSAAFSPDRIFAASGQPTINLQVTGSASARAFVEVKVGTRGEVIALTQKRDRFVYLPPMDLYRVRGDERSDAGNRFANFGPELRARASRLSAVEIAVPAGTTVLSFSPSPADRTFPGAAKPDFLFVLSDGSLRGARAAAPTQTISLPTPEPLQSIAYDKFVPPTFVAEYGTQPAGTVSLPYAGPRRLYGLTRAGQVKTWLEGAQATGVTLAIPGKVILLASESKTNLYALNGDGQVFWINADQAHAAAAGSTIVESTPTISYPRRFAPHTVRPVDTGGTKICWISRRDAVVCETGEARRWPESVASLRFDPNNDSPFDVVQVPVDIAAATPVAVEPIWRMSGVEEFFRLSFSKIAPSAFNQGLRYVAVGGSLLDPAQLQGQRNLFSELLPLPDGSRDQGLTGVQMRRALQSVFNASSPLGRGVTRATSTADVQFDGYRATLQLSPVTADTFDLTLTIANANGDVSADLPRTTMRIQFVGDPAGSAFTVLGMTGDDPGNSNTSFGQAYQFKDSDNIALNRSAKGWFGKYAAPVFRGPINGVDGSDRVAALIPTITHLSPFTFRVCYNVRAQVAVPGAVGNRYTVNACTIHDNFGNFIDAISMISNTFTPSGNGVTTETIDFGQLFDDSASTGG